MLLAATRGLCDDAMPQPVSPFPSLATVTNGLIRWWPNLFDAREVLSGVDGVVMGVLPQVPEGQPDPTEFGLETGWVLLRPSLTNQVFSASFWIKPSPHPNENAGLLEQRRNDEHWRLSLVGQFGSWAMMSRETGEPDPSMVFSIPSGWRHVVISLGPKGVPRYWVDGILQSRTRDTMVAMAPALWLSAGNMTKGDAPWKGHLRDLRIYDHVLDEVEVRQILACGLPSYPAARTHARVAATARPESVLWITNVTHVTPQRKTYRHYTTEDGLPGNMVQCLHQTSDGFLWIGTEDGLSRFDGSNFRSFNAENTPCLRITGHDISCLAEDLDGTLWAGTFKGLFKVRDGQFEACTNGLPQQFVQRVLPDRDGWLWVAGVITSHRPRGSTILRRYRPSSGTVAGELVVPGQLRDIAVVNNTVWMATQDPNLLLSWDGVSAAPTVEANVFIRAGKMDLSVASSAPESLRLRGWSEAGTSSNRWVEIQVGQAGPRFRWFHGAGKTFPKPSLGCPGARNDTFLGGTAGLARATEGLLEVLSLGETPTTPEITALCANRDGGVWFGTEEDGLHFFRDLPVHMLTTREGLAGNDVRSVAISPENQAWVATTRGLSYSEGASWKSFPVPGGKGAVTISSEGDVWFADSIRSRGAIRMIPEPNKPALYFPFLDWAEPSVLQFSEKGRLWVLCARGVSWISSGAADNTPTPHWTQISRPGYRMFRLGEDLPRTVLSGLVVSQDDTAWVGTQDQGLIHLHPDAAQVSRVTNAFLSGACTPLRCDDHGTLWISTSRGLVRKHGDNFQLVGPENGIPNDSFSDLFEDSHHRFWLPGKRGIHRVDRTEIEDFLAGKRTRVSSLTLGLADGLLTPECSSGSAPACAQDAQGRILVPTRNGLAVVDPRQVDASTQPVPVILDRVKVNQQEIAIPRSATLPLDRRDAGSDALLQLPAGSGRRMEFQFAGLSLTDAARVRFRYRLEGSDEDWLPVTDIRVAFYTNLKPGEYRFRVQAANSHGLWNSTDTVLAFQIQPFFWQTPSFYLGMALSGILLVVGIHLARLGAARRRQSIQHRQALMEEKNRLAMDLHDEVGSGLTRIAVLGESTKGRLPEKDNAYRALEEMTQAARDIASGISDLVWATHPKHETLRDLAVYLRGLGARQFEGTEITATLEFPDQLPHRTLPASFRRNVLLVWKEAIANIHKHSGATRVNLGFNVSDVKLSIIVTDNGRGFDPNALKGCGNGMGNMRRRAEELKGKLAVHSTPGSGTRIVLEIPYL